MAYIKKIKEGTETIYPATIPQAVVDPTSGKTVRTELDEKADQTDLDQLEGDVKQLAYVKIKNEVVNGNLENGLITPFVKGDGSGGTSTLAINNSTPISGNYDIRLTITIPATGVGRPYLSGINKADENIGDKIYIHFYAKILSGIPIIHGINNGLGSVIASYGGDVVNGRNTRIIDVEGTGNVGTIYLNSLSVWDMQMDNFMRINLTETFGAGNEPTEEEMNLLLDIAGLSYIDDEAIIPAQKIMQWQQQTLKQVDGVYRELDDKIEANDLDILERNKNFFIQETVTLGYFVNWNNGTLASNPEQNASDFMPVEPDTDYFYNKASYYALYDENKVFIEGKSGGYGGLIHTPANAAFARITVHNVYIKTAQFEKGSSETPYVKGGYVHKSYIMSEPSPISLPVTEIVMPPKYVAVVGSPIQIFYHGLIKTINPYKYNLRVNCGKGKDFRRYWEFTPQSTDVGTHTLTLYLYDDANNPISSASTQIEVVQFVQSPAIKKNILTVGDSLNNSVNDWGDCLAKQVVDGTNILTGLTPITNIDFIGTMGNAPKEYGGYGGGNWEEYNVASYATLPDVWVYATHDKDISDQESIWTDSLGNLWQLETIEATKLMFKRYGGHTANMPTAPSTLTHNLNAVHTATISYSSIELAEQNPFWNTATNKVDFKNWFNTRYPAKAAAGEVIDACYVLFGWNGKPYNKFTVEDWTAYIDTAKTFINNLHADYPNCKIYVMGVQYPSLNGGLGNNYGARFDYYSDLWSIIQSVQALNKAYQALCNDAMYSSFCKFINISGQFDSEFNMPYTTTPVNLRSSITERRGSNGVHPSAEGYMQISDAAIRMLIKEFCQ